MGSECCAFRANKYKNSIIVGIWVFVSMISFMLGQVEHELGFFSPQNLGCGKLRLCCFWFMP